MKSVVYFVLKMMVLVFLTATSRAYTIIIDPGHGGDDNGATKGGVVESKIALQVALKLAAKFEQNSDTKVILTRSRNESVPLKDRTDAAEQTAADLFVSLHGNSSSDSRAKGAEFYFGISNRSQLSPLKSTRGKVKEKEPSTLEKIVSSIQHNSRLYQSQFLAADTFNTWKDSNVTAPRAIRQAPFYVINRSPIPSILVEMGFITNKKESLELVKEETQTRIADTIYSAILDYRKKTQKN